MQEEAKIAPATEPRVDARTRLALDEVTHHWCWRTGRVARAIEAGFAALRDDTVLTLDHREALKEFAWMISESAPFADDAEIGMRYVRWHDAALALLGALRPDPLLIADLAASLTPHQAERFDARPLSEQQRDLFRQAVELSGSRAHAQMTQQRDATTSANIELRAQLRQLQDLIRTEREGAVRLTRQIADALGVSDPNPATSLILEILRVRLRGRGREAGYVPDELDRGTLARVHDSAPLTGPGDAIRRLTARILWAGCPTDSSECAIRRQCTNHCGALDSPGSGTAVDAPPREGEAPAEALTMEAYAARYGTLRERGEIDEEKLAQRCCDKFHGEAVFGILDDDSRARWRGLARYLQDARRSERGC